MLGEGKIIIDNIKFFRKILLKEGASESSIIDAINNRELVYIYYDGDKTQMTGYRIIVPFVLGVAAESQNRVLRAWQLQGNSDSFIGLSRTPRWNHEKFHDHDGSTKIGWRLFDIDKIRNFLPTGKHLTDDDGNFITPPLYNSNDKQMTGGIIAAAPETGKIDHVTGMDSVIEPDGEISTSDKTAFDRQADKMKQFHQQQGQIKPEQVQKLYDYVRTVQKKSPNNFLVYLTDKGQYNVTPKTNEPKLEADKVVGNLKNLYNKYVIPTKPKTSPFIDRERDDLKRELQKNNIEDNNTETKTFFKN